MRIKLFFFLHAFLFLVFASFVFSQNPNPTPPVSDDKDVVKISTTLIQFDVTVTDKNGKRVENLKPEDFEILENGKKQEITNFSYILSGSQTSTETTTKTVKNSNDKLPVPVPPFKIKPEQVRRTYALVVDDLGLSFSNMFWVKEALKKFINQQMQEGDLVAILRVSGGIGALQSFSSDKRLLMAAVDKIRWNGQGRVGVNSFEPIAQTVGDETNYIKDSLGVQITEGMVQNRENAASTANAYQSNYASGTLGALNYVIRGMSALPGRKSIMLFSEGFDSFDYSKMISGRSRMPETNEIYNDLRILAELANRSSVVIYTLDPRGLEVPGMAQAGDDVTITGDSTALPLRERKLIDTQNSLRYIADETGGKAYVNQNDLSNGIERVLDDQRGYYLIGYQPDSEIFEKDQDKFNKLKVKVNRPDLKVRYRSGFYGVTNEKYQKAPTPQQRLLGALVSPFGANEISVELYSIFYNDSQEGDFVRSLLHVDADDLTFTLEPDGLYRTKFNIIATVFDANGAGGDNSIKTESIQVTKEQYAKIKQKGFIYNLSVPIDKPGAYQFRIAMQDTATEKVGAASQFIEIPNLNKKQFTLSNLILKNYSLAEWKKISAGEGNVNSSDNSFLLDTLNRKFKQGTVFTYSFVIYNAKIAGQKPQLEVLTRLFRAGKMILEGSPAPINMSGTSDLKRISYLNAVTLGTDLQPGDYVLQIIVFDKLAKEKKQIAAQSIDFEIYK